MAVRNGFEWLSDTLASVRAQTESDYECVVVNDGSTDPRVAAFLAEWAAGDPRVRILEQGNTGLTRALIAGCAAARGALIARLDVGDAMLPGRLARQRALLDSHPDIAFVSCWTEYCGPAWEPLFVVRGRETAPEGEWVLPENPADDLLKGPTCHPSVMFRRSAYEAAGGYRWQFYWGQDWDLWYRLAERGRFAMAPEVLYRVRLLPGSLSAHHRRSQWRLGRYSREAARCRRLGLDESAALAAAARIRPTPTRAADRRRGEAEVCRLVGEALRRRGDPRAVHYLWRAVQLRPWHPVVWLRWAQAAGKKRI